MWRIIEMKSLYCNNVTIFLKIQSATTYLGLSEVLRPAEVFDTVAAHFEPISEAMHTTRFRHTAPRSGIRIADIKT